MRVTEPEKKEPANSKCFRLISLSSNGLIWWENNLWFEKFLDEFYHYDNRTEIASGVFGFGLVSDSNEFHQLHIMQYIFAMVNFYDSTILLILRPVPQRTYNERILFALSRTWSIVALIRFLGPFLKWKFTDIKQWRIIDIVLLNWNFLWYSIIDTPLYQIFIEPYKFVE